MDHNHDPDDHDTYDHLKLHGANVILDHDHELFDPADVVDEHEFRALVNVVGAAVSRAVAHHLARDDVSAYQLTADITVTVVHDFVEFLADNDDNDVPEVHDDHFPAPADTAEVPVTQKPEVW